MSLTEQQRLVVQQLSALDQELEIIYGQAEKLDEKYAGL